MGWDLWLTCSNLWCLSVAKPRPVCPLELGETKVFLKGHRSGTKEPHQPTLWESTKKQKTKKLPTHSPRMPPPKKRESAAQRHERIQAQEKAIGVHLAWSNGAGQWCRPMVQEGQRVTHVLHDRDWIWLSTQTKNPSVIL